MSRHHPPRAQAAALTALIALCALAPASATAAERTSPIVMDGKLDDVAWQAATPVTDFTQLDPEEGKPASERMEVRFLFDNGALYVGARMYDKLGRKGVTTSLVRRDDYFNSDYFEIVIDGYHDHLSRAFFQVNPAGSKSDFIGIGSSCCDSGWDPVWEAATQINDDGWAAEIRIPLSQLRFPNEAEQTWGLQIRQWIHRRQEQDQWSFWKKTESGGPNRFGHLEGLRIGGAGSKHIELMPYAVVPDAATILGAGKITGRTANGFTIGMLEAVTGSATANVQLADGSRISKEVEPFSSYFVGRVKKDLKQGNLVVGGILTSVTRNMDDVFAPRLANHAELAGGDFRYTWKNREYSLVGQYAFSNVGGDPRLIASKQRSSARYFQPTTRS